MDKNKYYKHLVAVYESTKMDQRETLTEAPQPQEKESPIRQVPNNIDPNANELQQPMQQEPMQQGPDDMGYLQDDGMMFPEPELSPIESVIEVSEQKKLVRLLGLFRELLDYTTIFNEDLEEIDTSTLESADNHEIRDLKGKLVKLAEKIRDYIVDSYEDETYEKSLYIYILVRTELLTIIKLLRKVLRVDRDYKEDDKNHKGS